MVKLPAVLAHNASLETMAPSLVAVFVGGTSGIALSTAKALARHTSSPKIYLIGRNATAAGSAISSIKSINPSSQPQFLQADISLLKNVDRVCADITSREKRLNLLFMTAGYLTLKGRDETSEGLDRKLTLHYYARMRFINRLLPLLEAAAAEQKKQSQSSTSTAEPSSYSITPRVVSVYDPQVAIAPGNGSTPLDFSDLSLKRNFTLGTCGVHGSLMNNFYLEGMAEKHPEVSFVHAYPSGVDTGVTKNLPLPVRMLARVVMPVMKALVMVPLEESGERHLFAGTNGRFPPKEGKKGEEEAVAMGSAGVKGSGCYWVSWDGEVFPPHKKFEGIRAQGAVEKVVKHTEEVFTSVCEEGGTYP